MPGSPEVALSPTNLHNPAWVGSKQANFDARTLAESGSAKSHGPCAEMEGHLEVGMCSKLCADGRISDAVDALDRMLQRGCHVPNNIFYRVLKRCIQDKDLVLGSRIHALTIKSGYEGDAFLATHLIGLYASHGRLEDANRVFTNVSTPDAYNWATIIFAYARHGEPTKAAEAIRLYRQMRESTTLQPDDRIYSAVLKACAAARDLIAGKEVHAHILARSGKPDRFVQAGLVNMYAKCGSLEDARNVYDKLAERNIVACNALLSGYAQQGMGQEALRLYRSIQQEGLTAASSVTYVCLLQACASVGVGALDQGKQLHVEIKERRLEEDVVLTGSLVNMYAKCGSLDDARILFNKLSDRDVVTWTAMIAGYAQQGMGQEALSLYRRMQQEGLTPPDPVTFLCLLKACASVGVGALDEGKRLHAQIKERGLQEDAVLGGSLLNMYAKCGSLEEARVVFNKLSDRDVVKWTAMIAGYAQQGLGREALILYRSMQQEGLTPPDSVTYVCLLQACASVGVEALHEGKQLHVQIKGRGLQEDVILGGSLVNMYAKCGSLRDARRAFDKLPEKNIVACNAMFAGYSQQGMGSEALSLYRSMQQGGLIHPNSVTYVCLLQACASVGIGGLCEGKQLHMQIKEQALQEDSVVGVSLVNMYAKCGSLQDARTLFDKLPERNVVAWNAMMAGYAHQGIGQEALCLYKCMQREGLTPPDAVTYVCLLQACASLGVGALDEGKQLHAQIKELGLQEDRVLAVSLVNMYAKCGSLEDARRLFDKLSERSVVTWNAIIAGYVQQGMCQEAIRLYSSMQKSLTPPDCVTYVWLLQVCAALAALPLGKQLHAEMTEQGIQADGIVGAALVNMYAKCGSMYESQRVFDSLPERSMEAWGALISGYAYQGDSQVVFDLLDRMRLEGIHPNDIMFLSVLTVCSHVGLVEKGREYFRAMNTDYGITATMEHFICMVDLLGRAGHLDEALQMAKTMPFPSKDVWYTLLGACRKWNNVEIGQQAFISAVNVDEKDGASYALMSNIYASAGMWDAANEMQARRKNVGAWKEPGQSWWTDVDGVVHTFFVGDKNHPQREGIYARLEQLVPKIKEGNVPNLQSSLVLTMGRKLSWVG